ncbi:hypothetical protein [Streptomyces erythrochromogenes]|uniref:hypothetical protein n=1 Tax=Streptomyces erythrochromogenes TaxID=285574 RepID=UPI0036F60A8D
MPPAQYAEFLTAITHFVADLKAGTGFRKGLRVKKMQGHDHIWEMTFGDDWRATFEYGETQVPGEIHITWRRIGTHKVFKRP